MSYQEGWAAINLEMPDKIPRTEYSADRHWKLVEKVTGIAANESSPISLQQQASSAFYKAWDYGFKWNVLIHNQPLEKCRTKMGHASFAEDGADYSTEVFCPFDDPRIFLIFSLQKFIMSSRIRNLFRISMKIMQNNVVWLLMQ